jgi:hypothetical protein
MSTDPKSGWYDPPPSPHGERAVVLLERAAGEVRSREDAIPTVTEALANLRAEVGEIPPEEAAELLRMAAEE